MTTRTLATRTAAGPLGTAAVAAPPGTVPAAATLALARAVAIEARKLVNTRAGVALVVAGALLSGVFAGGSALFPTPETGFAQLASMAAMPVAMIVMAMSALLAAGEFSAGTAPVTLTLDPRRGRVVAAKALVVLTLAIVATLLAFAAAALTMLVAPALTGVPLSWGNSLLRLGVLLGNAVHLALAGFVLALALRNAPAPIAFLLVWPTVAMLISRISAGAAAVMSFVSIDPFYNLMPDVTGAGVPGLVVSVLFWLVLPGAIGILRLLRDDL